MKIDDLAGDDRSAAQKKHYTFQHKWNETVLRLFVYLSSSRPDKMVSETLLWHPMVMKTDLKGQHLETMAWGKALSTIGQAPHTAPLEKLRGFGGESYCVMACVIESCAVCCELFLWKFMCPQSSLWVSANSTTTRSCFPPIDGVCRRVTPPVAAVLFKSFACLRTTSARTESSLATGSWFPYIFSQFATQWPTSFRLNYELLSILRCLPFYHDGWGGSRLCW